MGCTVREKHVRANRKSRPVKLEFDPCCLMLDNKTNPKSTIESSLKHLVYHPGLPNPGQNPNPIGESDENGWGYCTEDELEDILLKHLDCLYNEAIAKLVGLGYKEDVALRAVLSNNGYCYGEMDVLTNVLGNSLAYLSSNGCCGGGEGGSSDVNNDDDDDDGDGDDDEIVFTDLRHLQEYSLAGMVYLLQQVKPNLSKGDAMWCLLMSELHVGKASLMDIPSSRDGCDSKSEKEIYCPKRFNLSPSMKSLLRENVSAFAAGYRASMEQKKQSRTQFESSGNNLSCIQPRSNSVSEESVSSVLEKFRELNLDDGIGSTPEELKDDALLALVNQIQDIKKQVKERKEWAHRKAMQAAQKVSNELNELKCLRSDRDEIQRLNKVKKTCEDTTVKRLSDVENTLRQATTHGDKTNLLARTLQNENAEIRAEMEAYKLSASESLTACIEASKKEKKCLKKLMAWEKQRTKLQDEITAEKVKIQTLNKALVQITQEEKEYEARWRQEQKAKDQALAQVEEEQRSKEATEAINKRNVESLRLKIEIDFQRHKDDLQRLEQELSRLNKASSRDSGLKGKTGKFKGEAMSKVLEAMDSSYEKESSYDRECMICMKEEVSVVFLPCAHQVVCVSCSDNFMGGDKETCLCCRAPVEQRIRVFGATS
ncbi:unnamed protein product [Cochlearia groenlandica]